MKKKSLLKSRRGSTLIEVLCAFLVIALSTAILATSVGAANRINVEASRHWNTLLAEISAVELKSHEVGTKGLKIHWAASDVLLKQTQVKIYDGSSGGGGLVCYIPG